MSAFGTNPENPNIEYVDPFPKKRGSLKPADQWEESIRNAAFRYTVTLIGRGQRAVTDFGTLDEAKSYSIDCIRTGRWSAAMTYAIRDDERSALVCTLSRGREVFKYAELKRW